jgi:hypothetical protein
MGVISRHAIGKFVAGTVQKSFILLLCAMMAESYALRNEGKQQKDYIIISDF